MTMTELHSKYPKYFDEDGYCDEHSDGGCTECIEKGRAEAPSSQLVVVATNAEKYSNGDRANALRSFEDQVEFVQTALDYTDVAMARTKLADMPALFEKAKQQIIVGKLRTYLNGDEEERKKKNKKLGFTGRLLKRIFG